MLVFDDSFEHEVIHESEGQRIVLIIDFHHPDMSQVNIYVDVKFSFGMLRPSSPSLSDV